MKQLDSLTFTQKPKTWKVSDKITIDWENILPEPPANGSETTIKELKYLEELTQNLGTREKTLVLMVDKEPLELYNDLFQGMGATMPVDKFKQVWNILDPIIMNVKNKHNRARPYQLGPLLGYDIKVTHTKTHDSPAYPSGHTSYAALAAYMFADMYPQYSSHFFSRIQTAGLARMLQGVHYPSDNEAAMVLTGAVWQDVRYKMFPELEPYRS